MVNKKISPGKRVLEHVIVSFATLVILQVGVYLIQPTEPGGSQHTIAGVLMSFLYALPSMVIAIPSLIATYRIYSAIRKKTPQLRLKDAAIKFAVFGLIVPVVMVVVGAIAGITDDEARWLILIGAYLAIPFALLTISNFGYFWFTVKKTLKI